MQKKISLVPRCPESDQMVKATPSLAIPDRLGRILAFWSLLSLAGTGTAQDLRVEKGVWTSGVQNRQYTTELRSGASVGNLFFWTLLKGGRGTLVELQSQGKLPIIHEWTFASPLRIPPDPLSPFQEDEQEAAKLLGVGAIIDQGGLTSAVDEGREFRWRTWSHKQSLWRGTWVVRVLYADGQPVACGKQPCHWSFFVR
jgi:hypothetical protein